jgi:hypothetical protein
MAEARAWYRRKNETLQAYEAFSAYLTQGPDRSQERVSQQLGKSRQLISRWSARHDWVVRVSAYEEQFALKVLDATEDERIELMREHMQFASMLLKKSRARLEALADEVSTNPVEQVVGEKTGAYPTVDQALRAGDLAVKVGRLATGLDGKYVPQAHGTTDVSNLSEEELETLEQLLDKAKS